MAEDIEQRNIEGTRYSFIGKASSSTILFFLSIIVARYLGAEAFGELSLSLMIVVFSSVVIDAGINRSAQKHISQYLKKDRASVQFAYKRVFSIKAVSALSGMLLLYFLAPAFAGLFQVPGLEGLLRVGSLLLAATLFLEYNITVLQGYEAFGKICLAAVLEAGLKLVFAVFIIYLGRGVTGIFAGYACSTFVVALVLTVAVYSLVVGNKKIATPSRNLTREILRYSPPLLFSTTFFIFYTKFDILALGYFGKTADVGHYTLAVGLVDNLLIPLAAIETAVMPIAASLYGQETERNASLSKLFNHTLINGFFFMAPVIAGLLVVAHNFIIEVYGPEFEESGLILMALTPFILTRTLAVVNGAYLIAANRARVFMNFGFLAVIFNLVLLFLLIPAFGVYGAVLAKLASHFLLTFSMLTYVVRNFNLRIYRASFLKILRIIASATFMGVLCYFLQLMVGEGIYSLLITMAAGVVTYVLLLHLTKAVIFRDLLKIALGKELSFKNIHN